MHEEVSKLTIRLVVDACWLRRLVLLTLIVPLHARGWVKQL